MNDKLIEQSSIHHYEQRQKNDALSNKKSTESKHFSLFISSSISNEQNLSSESNQERETSDLSSKTTASDPIGLVEAKFDGSCAQSKAVSYQDIHTEYSKRRFKHVVSKVGQYIANLKVEEEKHRNSVTIQRHRSLPDALTGDPITSDKCISTAVARSSLELQKLLASTSDVDTSFKQMPLSSGSSRKIKNWHDCGKDGIVAAYSLLQRENENLSNYVDHQQSLLYEKTSEIVRLKRNNDCLRIQLGEIQNKLNYHTTIQRRTDLTGGASYGSNSGIFKRYSSPGISTIAFKNHKTTQTETTTSLLFPPLALLSSIEHATPNTADANNNLYQNGDNDDTVIVGDSTEATTRQSLVLNFSNIADEQQDAAGAHFVNCSLVTLPSDLNRVKPPFQLSYTTLNSFMHRPMRTGQRSENSQQSNNDSTIKILEFVDYHELKPSVKQQVLFVSNFARIGLIQQNDESSNSRIDASSTNPRSVNKKKRSLQSRMLRFLGSCARCKDQSHTIDTTFNQTYTQVPLLERSSPRYHN